MHDYTKSIMMLAAALALFGLAAGTVSAATVTDWNGSQPVNDTFSVDNQTESVRVTAENITNDQATVTVYGVENGTETQVASTTISTDATNGTYTTQYDYEVDTANYTTYKVSVSGDGADSLSLAKVNVVTGAAGGGGLPGTGVLSSVPMVEVVAGALVLVAVGAAAVVQRRA